MKFESWQALIPLDFGNIYAYIYVNASGYISICSHSVSVSMPLFNIFT